ncbi:Hypothetical protein PHPALM_37646 [Phytophthora palmivora]|uniref:Uncharacterized protein n=1 Tax=Phytophthora palmivora TaxID=4796 RepID=A0A2P4WWX3_9STRA|nr:Hypothetical protein PHPALM_37646 [Phytophthora palmivora]
MEPPSDFPPAPVPERGPWSPSVWVGSTVFATFALGFMEGCLKIERRPIPLRFALRFAVVNMLPSTVWSSISARHVAAASGVPFSALLNDAEITGSRSLTVGRRLVLVKSVRALRLAVGSYGLAWSLWGLYASDRNNTEQEVIKYVESVVRLAPVNSPLSRASRRKHGDHIVKVPVITESWKTQGVEKVVDAVDWEKVGIQVQLEEEKLMEKVKVIEVELSDADMTATYAGNLKAKVSRESSTPVCSVAVLPMCGPPLPMSIVDSFDVHFNPLSAVLLFIASVCHQRWVARVVLVGSKDNDEKHEDGTSNRYAKESLTSLLETGLLYRHGITASVLKIQNKELTEEPIEDKSTTDDNNDEMVFFISESLSAGHAAANEMREQGYVTQQRECFIVEESLSGQSIDGKDLQVQSEVLRMATSVDKEKYNVTERQTTEVDEQERVATYLSVADLTDQTLQGIREFVRKGMKPELIQATVYQAYGTQRVVAPPRLDQFSNMHV